MSQNSYPESININALKILKNGNPRQQLAYQCISSHQLFEHLSEFRTILASTITLAIDTPSSDLDFVCEVSDLNYFSKQIIVIFEKYDRFKETQRPAESLSRCFSFWCDEFEIEVFGSIQPLEQQFGFIHYLVTAKLIELGGEVFRSKLQDMKLAGKKTEPAIAEMLSLNGDPYQEVARLIDIGGEEELLCIINLAIYKSS